MAKSNINKLIKMKKLLTVIAILVALNAGAQKTSAERDSVANTSAFQTKVKMATHKAANALLADPGQSSIVRKYAQLIVSLPAGEGWLPALSYGCMTNAAINWNSSDGDIEFTVNSLFAKYAYAYYREAQP